MKYALLAIMSFFWISHSEAASKRKPAAEAEAWYHNYAKPIVLHAQLCGLWKRGNRGDRYICISKTPFKGREYLTVQDAYQGKVLEFRPVTRALDNQKEVVFEWASTSCSPVYIGSRGKVITECLEGLTFNKKEKTGMVHGIPFTNSSNNEAFYGGTVGTNEEFAMSQLPPDTVLSVSNDDGSSLIKTSLY